MEMEELREQTECLKREPTQLKTKPKFDINEHKDKDNDGHFLLVSLLMTQ